MNFRVIIILGLLFFSSCSTEPEEIAYGKDQCSFCKMNVVDKTHAAQYVTAKGKQFKFDAIECMINDLADKNEDEVEVVLVADYNNPGKMIDSKTASYLVSDGIKSPMGENLSALSTIEEALKLQSEYSGEVYNWNEIKEYLSKNK